MKGCRNRGPALLSSFFEIFDGPYDIGVTHVARRVIVLVHTEDAGVPLVQIVKSLKVCGVLCDDGETLCFRKGKVDEVILAAQLYSVIGRANYPMPSLSKEFSQEIRIGAVVKI
jgi:hypothetical protein